MPQPQKASHCPALRSMAARAIFYHRTLSMQGVGVSSKSHLAAEKQQSSQRSASSASSSRGVRSMRRHSVGSSRAACHHAAHASPAPWRISLCPALRKTAKRISRGRDAQPLSVVVAMAQIAEAWRRLFLAPVLITSFLNILCAC